MKVVFLGENDWANTSNRIARSVNRCCKEMSMRVITVRPHPFGYHEDIVLECSGVDQAKKLVQQADWIISSGDGNYTVFEELLELLGPVSDGVKLGTRHAGTAFRSDPAFYNVQDHEVWNFKRRFVACDLYRFVKDDPTARVFIQSQDNIATSVKNNGPAIRICHTPSNRLSKNTKAILKVMDSIMRRFKGRVVFELIENLPFNECLKTRNTFDILIDQLNPVVGGFGASAMEALANGILVMSDHSRVNRLIEKWFPLPPAIMVKTPAMLKNSLIQLINNPPLVLKLRNAGLEWAQHYLTPEFTYRYWQQCLTL